MKHQRGFVSVFSAIVIVIVVLGIGGGVWWYTEFRPVPTTSVEKIDNIDKSDPEWMRKYCLEELAKLPEAPFAYYATEGPDFTGASTWVRKLVPEDKRQSDRMVTCVLAYKFHEENEAAYSSVGVEYKFNIKQANEFGEQIDSRVTDAMAPGWEKISPFAREETGTPGYSYDGLPAVFRRENPEAGTVEFVDIYTAVNLYVKFTAYVK